MLGQRMEPVLSSQTLPKLDGQDEDGDHLVEGQFEMLCATNSCPDLSVLEEEHLSTLEDSKNEGFDTVIRRGHHHHHQSNKNEDQLDGIFTKHVVASSTVINVPSKIPLGFRRSTSLNSLGVDQDFGQGSHDSGNDAEPGFARIIPGGVVAAVAVQLDKQLKLGAVKCAPISATDFVRSKLRASDSGRPGYLHKSISSPSVSHQFPSTFVSTSDQRPKNLANFRSTSQSDAHQHSSKRSFFRRKHKFKGHSMNSHSALHSFDTGVMNGILQNHHGGGSGGSGGSGGGGGGGAGFPSNESSLGLTALSDPALGLQDADAECWALFMDSELISSLDEKEVKRQEHMYELILTEKHHCLTLALMHHLFIGDMRKHGFSRQARLLFPDLKELLQVHYNFLKKLRERQYKYRQLGQPVDTLSDILIEQFNGPVLMNEMVRLYGLLCASHNKSLEIFRSLMKEPKFASLVASWDKESLLARKNVRECLLLVAQRITKYPLLFEPLMKTAVSSHEREQIAKAHSSSRDLIARVNERVAERQRLLEICQRIDPKSYVTIGQKRRGRDDLVSVPSRRLLFHGQAVINCNRIGIGSVANVSCTVLILTDCLVFTQEFGGRLQFVCPPGIVMLSPDLMVRPNAVHSLSMFLVTSDSGKPEMIEIIVSNPPNRDLWMEKIKDAKAKYQEKMDTFSDVDDEMSNDAVDYTEIRTAKAIDELQENDRQILALLRSRSKIIDVLRTDKPQNWITSQLDGKDGVMSAMSAACNEVRLMINHIDANQVTVVNRSTSCVGEIGSSNAIQGLPKRADTFGGFDSQQRLHGDANTNVNGRQLLEMVVQLEDVCGELFSLLVHQMSPTVYQNYYQLQRRMEDLREAQQRLEADKALWQQEFNGQKEFMEKEKQEMGACKMNLQKEQEDITQQREQLYRKLEAMQRNPCNCNWKGLVPTPDSISPGASSDKPPQSAIPRRPVQPSSTTKAATQSTASERKQQLPLHLASFSSSKGSGGGIGGGGSVSNLGCSSSNSEPPPKPHPRSSVQSSFKSSISASSLLQSVGSNGNNDISRGPSWGQPTIRNSSSSSQVQQLLPLRLSEGTNAASAAASVKTSSLPRGVTSSRSATNVNHLDMSSVNSGRVQRHSGTGNSNSSAGYYNVNFSDQPSNSSYLHGPATSSSERMNAYFPTKPSPHHYPAHHMPSDGSSSQHQLRSPLGAQTNGTVLDPSTGVPILHRRSGSSPVPMTGSSSTGNNSSANSSRVAAHHNHHHHHHHHRFFQPQDDDYDSSKILYL